MEEERDTLFNSASAARANIRRTSGSAIVLNAQKLQRCLVNVSKKGSNSIDLQEVEHECNRKNKPYDGLSEHDAAIRIQNNWWIFLHKEANLETYASGHLEEDITYNVRGSDRVLALVLGWRVRSLMRSCGVKSHRREIDDVYEVLLGIAGLSISSVKAKKRRKVSDEREIHRKTFQ